MPHLLCTLLCLASLTAFAQQHLPRPDRHAPPLQHITFDEDGIIGTTRGPDGEIITERPAPVFQSLVKVRDNFSRELLDSVHSL